MGAFDHLEWTYHGAFEQLFGLGRGEFEQKIFQKFKCPGGCPGGCLSFDLTGTFAHTVVVLRTVLSRAITLKPLSKQKIGFFQLYWFSYRKISFRNMTFLSRLLTNIPANHLSASPCISTAILDTRLVFMLLFRGLPGRSANILFLCCVSTTLCCVLIILCCVSVIWCCVSTTLCCVSIVLCYVSQMLTCVSQILCCASRIVYCVCRYGPPYRTIAVRRTKLILHFRRRKKAGRSW